MPTPHRRFSRRSSADRRRAAGFTIIEILVTAGIVTTVMAAVVSFMLSTARHRREMEVRLETTQGLRAAADVLERDLRLAGSCLPPLGNFVALAGKDSGTSDEITLRIGLRFEGACLRTNLKKAVEADSTKDLDVDHTDGFADGTHLYIVDLGGSGEFVDLASTSGSKRMTTSATLTHAYPVGSTVYAYEQRTYALSAATPLSPAMMTVREYGDDSAWPMALGITAFNARYTLKRGNCPLACEEVDLPADDTAWRLVTSLTIDLTASNPGALGNGRAFTSSETIRVKPRNLLP